MRSTNGSTNGHEVVSPPVSPQLMPTPRVSQKRLKMLEDLAVPFEPVVIQWRIVETARIAGNWRGRVIPYADKLAYLDRLNRLLTPIGWSSSVNVHQAMVNSGERTRTVPAKVVVTCQLTLHGLGFHSSTGEEWATNENAATSAESQAFKRVCAHFGLGAYLYYFFRGSWADLDQNKKLISAPALPEWATPAGWLAGARPSNERVREAQGPTRIDVAMIREMESMRNDLGLQVYRRILKNYRVWDPKQISTAEIAGKILQDMKLAHSLMLRASYALEQLGKVPFEDIIKRHNLKSVSDFGDLASLERIVAELEAKVSEVTS